jgi:hypothetical protein
MLAEKDYWHRLAEVPTQKMAEALENLVKVYAPSHADMNLEAVLKALETGWQLTQVILTRGGASRSRSSQCPFSVKTG